MKYPTGIDLTAYLAAAGLPATTRANDLMKAAVAKWERATGYKPYLSEDGAIATTRTFFIPVQFKLYLHSGLLSIASIVRPSDSMTLVEGTDYRVKTGAPYTEILFSGSRFQNVEITGLWGKTDTLDDYLKDMLIRLAADIGTAQSEYQATGGISKIQTLSTVFEFGKSGKNYFERTHSAFAEEYRTLVLQEKLLGMGN